MFPLDKLDAQGASTPLAGMIHLRLILTSAVALGFLAACGGDEGGAEDDGGSGGTSGGGATSTGGKTGSVPADVNSVIGTLADGTLIQFAGGAVAQNGKSNNIAELNVVITEGAADGPGAEKAAPGMHTLAFAITRNGTTFAPVEVGTYSFKASGDPTTFGTARLTRFNDTCLKKDLLRSEGSYEGEIVITAIDEMHVTGSFDAQSKDQATGQETARLSAAFDVDFRTDGLGVGVANCYQ